MTDKEMNKLADLIVDKLLTTYIKEQAAWYTTTTGAGIFDIPKDKPKKKAKKDNTESELLGRLAALMTQLHYHQDKEEYEECAEIKKEIDIVNNKLDHIVIGDFNNSFICKITNFSKKVNFSMSHPIGKIHYTLYYQTLLQCQILNWFIKVNSLKIVKI